MQNRRIPSLLQCTRGAVMGMFVIMVPAIAAITALVVDMGGMWSVREKAQVALDAAMLGSTNPTTCDGTTASTATQLFRANMQSGFMGVNTTSTTVGVQTQSAPDGCEGTVTVSYSPRMMGMLGVGATSVTVKSRVTGSGGAQYEIVILLESSIMMDDFNAAASLGGAGGDLLHSELKTFVDNVNTALGSSNVRWSVIKYADGVKFGSAPTAFSSTPPAGPSNIYANRGVGSCTNASCTIIAGNKDATDEAPSTAPLRGYWGPFLMDDPFHTPTTMTFTSHIGSTVKPISFVQSATSGTVTLDPATPLKGNTAFDCGRDNNTLDWVGIPTSGGVPPTNASSEKLLVSFPRYYKAPQYNFQAGQINTNEHGTNTNNGGDTTERAQYDLTYYAIEKATGSTCANTQTGWWYTYSNAGCNGSCSNSVPISGGGFPNNYVDFNANLHWFLPTPCVGAIYVPGDIRFSSEYLLGGSVALEFQTYATDCGVKKDGSDFSVNSIQYNSNLGIGSSYIAMTKNDMAALNPFNPNGDSTFDAYDGPVRHNVGLQWAWYALSPNWRGLFNNIGNYNAATDPSGDGLYPLNYGDSRKIVVMIARQENNVVPNYDNPATLAICNAMSPYPGGSNDPRNITFYYIPYVTLSFPQLDPIMTNNCKAQRFAAINQTSLNSHLIAIKTQISVLPPVNSTGGGAPRLVK